MYRFCWKSLSMDWISGREVCIWIWPSGGEDIPGRYWNDWMQRDVCWGSIRMRMLWLMCRKMIVLFLWIIISDICVILCAIMGMKKRMAFWRIWGYLLMNSMKPAGDFRSGSKRNWIWGWTNGVSWQPLPCWIPTMQNSWPLFSGITGRWRMPGGWWIWSWKPGQIRK